nr:XcbB/CpsF family capsular polysaccharide biosynthesis protein [Brachybacterium faecium]
MTTPAADDRPVDLMREGLTDGNVRSLMTSLANHGFSLYYNNLSENRFIRHDRIYRHWDALKDGQLRFTESGIVYEYEPPDAPQVEQLIVIFSPISSVPRLRRFNWRSFGGIRKYVAPRTGILRVADLGGVKGAFYLNTTFLPSNAQNVQDLIRDFAASLGVVDNRIVLYGASKGGTGATYHGLRAGLKFVAVDPILSDEWYETHESDYHYTADGVFPRPKQEVFEGLVAHVSGSVDRDPPRGVVVTSDKSPQYETVVESLAPLSDSLLFLNSTNPAILKHPDVAPNTIYSQLMAINSLIMDIPLPSGKVAIP